MSVYTDNLEERKKTAEDKIKTLLDALDSEEREQHSFTEEEEEEFRTATADLEKVLSDIDGYNKTREVQARSAALIVSDLGGFENRTQVTDPEVYAKGDNQRSYFRDLFRAKQGGDRDAFDRLTRSSKQTADLLEKRTGTSGMAPTTGVGGEFTPPLWQVDQFAAFARPGRPLANCLTNLDLPRGVSSINLPKITAGSQVEVQSSANTNLNLTVPTTGVATGSVGTVAGGVVVAQQELDQSPINMDLVILQDLAASYAQQLDGLVIAGIAGTSDINSVTYTDASPTTPKLLPYVQQAVDAVSTTRFLPPTVIGMTPARWGHFLAFNDSSNRPLVIPNPSYGAFNVIGNSDGQNAQGVAGTLRGIPVVLDASIPTNLGSGTNQDEIFVLRADDIYLYEGTPVAEVLPQTYGTQLSVLCRFYRYYTLIPNRYPASIALITGTGLVPPAYGA